MNKRKELKLAYKQTSQPMGVYQIKNQINGKILLGSSMNLYGNSNSYRFKLDFQSHHNKDLKHDLELYDFEAFSFEILETLQADEIPKEDWREAVAALEEKWLNTLQPYGDRGYNSQKKTKA